MTATDLKVLHAYGIVNVEDRVDLPTSGVLGASVELVPCDEYVVACSVLRDEEFGAPVWNDRAEDLGWLRTVAEQHHHVLRHIADQVDVIPLRLPGLYSDEQVLCDAIHESADALRASMQVVRGHLEWGVKVFKEPAPATPPEQPRPTSGHEYLSMRAAQAGQKEKERDALHSVILDIHEALALVATHSAVNPVQDRTLTGRQTPMVLNAAYLVPRSGGADFFSTVDRLAERFGVDGYVVELTGPWPPYNFSYVTAAPSEETS